MGGWNICRNHSFTKFTSNNITVHACDCNPQEYILLTQTKCILKGMPLYRLTMNTLILGSLNTKGSMSRNREIQQIEGLQLTCFTFANYTKTCDQEVHGEGFSQGLAGFSVSEGSCSLSFFGFMIYYIYKFSPLLKILSSFSL